MSWFASFFLVIFFFRCWRFGWCGETFELRLAVFSPFASHPCACVCVFHVGRPLVLFCLCVCMYQATLFLVLSWPFFFTWFCKRTDSLTAVDVPALTSTGEYFYIAVSVLVCFFFWFYSSSYGHAPFCVSSVGSPVFSVGVVFSYTLFSPYTMKRRKQKHCSQEKTLLGKTTKRPGGEKVINRTVNKSLQMLQEEILKK